MSGGTARTLRHYDRTGLLPPAWTGGNGHRYYEERQLLRLHSGSATDPVRPDLPEGGAAVMQRRRFRHALLEELNLKRLSRMFSTIG
ncbi:MerR family DNA-binding transcriptional regulator [Streptomyces sp. NPDC018019]|uniref:MerR family DNA-binding transcriptional regulator n=1 Tax=Streptomyces sp. NPDC018019 TaxID=3365030 RepID=UPI0037AE24DA